MFCREKTLALRRYQRRVQVAMGVYVALVFLAARMVKHGAHAGWTLYFWSVLPAVPVLAVIVAMARYLKEETDEYQRLVMMRSLLVGTAALLGMLVVSDFVRGFAGTEPFPPFTCFVVFALSFGITNGVQKLRDRVTGDE